jgi:UDP-N-acetylglucosamine 1-carboxyvinyltransferase
MQHGAVVAHAPGGLHPAHIVLDFPSVGATHNLMMAAALTPGVSIIDGAAREPEVVELAQLLNQMGAEIDGDGTSVIRVRGKEKLSGANIEVLGDRIEAATYLVAGAVTGGDVTVCGIKPEALQSTLGVLSQMGVEVDAAASKVRIVGPERINPCSFETAPYPGLATDVQPLLMAALTGADGMSTVKETVFENRFGHVAEYRRLGADITIAGQVASIRGVDTLSAAPVEATDIRAAAGLVIMGLQAEGITEIHDIHHLDRGYEGMVSKLQSLGAEIQRVPEAETKELVFGC